VSEDDEVFPAVFDEAGLVSEDDEAVPELSAEPDFDGIAELERILPPLTAGDIADDIFDEIPELEIGASDVDLSDLQSLLGELVLEPEDTESPGAAAIGTADLGGGADSFDPSLGPVALDLWEIVDTVLEEDHPDTPVATNRNGSMAKVFGDPRTVREVLGLLVRNAEVHGGPSLTVRVDRLDDEFALSVIDDGPGLSEEVRARVFRPAAEPNGTALAEARRRMRDLGGDLTYDSRRGHAVFAMTLPAV
jgi:signal transduction histidine kinase